MGENGTRLVMLSLGAEACPPSRRFTEVVFWEPAHFVMERRMMLTIKRLAENNPLLLVVPAQDTEKVHVRPPTRPAQS